MAQICEKTGQSSEFSQWLRKKTELIGPQGLQIGKHGLVSTLFLPSACSVYCLYFPKGLFVCRYLWSAFCLLGLKIMPENILCPQFSQEEIKAQRKSHWTEIADNFMRSFPTYLMSFKFSDDLYVPRVGNSQSGFVSTTNTWPSNLGKVAHQIVRS